jgi:hypothetical protein
VALILSEGDNIAWHAINRPVLWDDPARTRIPTGWVTAPSMYDLIPNMMRYYIRTGSETDCHVGPHGGIGYSFVYRYGQRLGKDREQLVKEFLERTNRFFTDSGMQVTHSLDHADTDYSTPRWTAERFAKYAPTVSGLFCGYPCYWDQGETRPGPYCLEGRLAVIHTEIRTDTRDVAGEIRKAVEGTAKPGFVYAMRSGWHLFDEELVNNLNSLGPEFQLVRPDQLATLMLEALEKKS